MLEASYERLDIPATADEPGVPTNYMLSIHQEKVIRLGDQSHVTSFDLT